MSVEQSYDQWASQYDSNHNKTRDLEGFALRETLAGQRFQRVLEIGCGTGKNSTWLQAICSELVGVDVSSEMLARAKDKVSASHVTFKQADITGEWNFGSAGFDLITFSLVLEHIKDLMPIFEKASGILQPGGTVYIGELHPFKQYGGTKARFDTEEGRQLVDCYIHHLSDFTGQAARAGFEIREVQEFFDGNDRTLVPRLLILRLQKAGGRVI